jgi:hypothetical protein
MATPLKIQIVVDDRGTVSIQKLGDQAERAGSKGETAFRKTGRSLDDMNRHAVQARSHILKIAAAAASLYAVARSMQSVVTAASNLEEVINKYNVVFAGQVDLVNKWVETLKEGYYMSTREAKQYLSSIQDLLVPMGMAASKAAVLSNEVVKLSADLGSFNNLPTAKVMEDIQSALVGNFETMKKYGVVLNATLVQEKALAMGLAGTKDALTAAHRAQAAYQLMVEGSTAAIGDMERSAGSYANQMKQLKARTEDMKALLGEQLLPTITAVVAAINNWLEANDTLIRQKVPAIIGEMVKSWKSLHASALKVYQVWLKMQELNIRIADPFGNDKIWQQMLTDVRQKLADVALSYAEVMEGIDTTQKGFETLAESAEKAGNIFDDPVTKNAGAASAAFTITTKETDHLAAAFDNLKKKMDALESAKAWEAQDLYDWVMGYGDVIDRLAREVDQAVSESVAAYEKANGKIKADTAETTDIVYDLWMRGMDRVQKAFADTFYDAMTGELDDLGDVFDAFFKDILRMVAEFAAKMTMYDLFGIGDFGWGRLFSGSGPGLADLVSGASTVSELLSGETFVTTLMGSAGGIGDAIFGSAMVDYGSGAISGVGGLFGSGGTLAGGSLLATGGFMAAIAAAWVFGSIALGEALMGGPDASVTARVKLAMNKSLADLFAASFLSVSNAGFSEGDLRNALDRIGTLVDDAIGMYEGLYDALGEESKKKLKDAISQIDFSDYVINITQWAREGAPVYASLQSTMDRWIASMIYGAAEFDSFTGRWAATMYSFVDQSGSVVSVLQEIFGKEFVPYLDEMLDAIRASDIFQFLADDLQSAFANVSAVDFVEDIDAFYDAVGRHIADVQEAARVWKKLNDWVEDIAGGTTEMDRATQSVNAYVAAYVAQMEELGVTMSEAEISDFTKKIAEKFFEDLLNPEGFARPLSASEMLMLQISAAFDAYVARLKALGVDIAKITELEKMRETIIQREIAALEKAMSAAIGATIDKWSGRSSPITDVLDQLIADFANIYAALESVFGIADYTEEIAELTAQLNELYEEQAAQIKELQDLIEALKAGDFSGATDWFKALLDEMMEQAGSPAEFAALAQALQSTLGGMKGAVQDQIDFWHQTGWEGIFPIHEVEGVVAAAIELSDAFAALEQALSFPTITTSGLIDAFDASIEAARKYIDEIDKALARPLAWEDPSLNAALEAAKKWAESVLPILEMFKAEAEALQQTGGTPEEIAFIQQILADMGAGDAAAAIEYLQKKLDELIASGGASQAEIDALIKLIEDLTEATQLYAEMQEKQLYAMKVQMGLISEYEAQAARMKEIMELLSKTSAGFGGDASSWVEWFKDADLEEVKRMAELLGVEWEELAKMMGFLVDAIKKTEEAIQRLRESVYGEDVFADAATAAQEFADKYHLPIDVIADDWIDAVKQWLLAMSPTELEELAKRYGVSVAELIDDLLALEEAFDAVAAEIKRIQQWQNELLGKGSAQSIIDDIKQKYGIPFEITQKYIQGLIDWIGHMTAAELQALAELYHATVDELMADVDALIAAYEELEAQRKSIRAWQASILGANNQYIIDSFAAKYGLMFEITEEWVQALIKWVGYMSTEDLIALAEEYGVSVEELMDDISRLIGAFKLAADDFEDIVDRIQSILATLRESIYDLVGLAPLASGIARQINAVLGKDLADLTIGDLLDAAELMQDWFHAAVQEAQDLVDAQKEEMQGQIDLLEEQIEALELQERVADRLEGLISSIDHVIQRITYSKLNVALPAQKAPEAEQELEALYQAALAGGLAEVQEFLNFAPTALQQYQDAYKSSEEYQQFYATAMGWIDDIRGKAVSGGYDEAILAELEDTNEEIKALRDQIEAIRQAMKDLKPDYTAIVEQFNAWSAQIESLIEQLEGLHIILSIDWTNYHGTMEEAIQMLMELVAVYGWENDIVIHWIADFARWVSGDIQSAIDLLNYIAAESGGWDTSVVIAFIANLDMNSFNGFADVMTMLNFLVGSAGWESTAVIAFLSNMGSFDFESFEDVMAMLEFIVGSTGWESAATLAFLAAVDLTSFGDFEDVMAFLKFIAESAGWGSQAIIAFLGNIDPSGFLSFEQKMEMLGFVAAETGWLSDATLTFVSQLADDWYTTWAEIEDYLEQLGVDPEIIASLKTQYNLNSDWLTWEDFLADLDFLNALDPETLAQIKAIYDAYGSTWESWADVEAALAELNLDPEVIASIKAEWAADNQWSSWEAVQAVLEQMGVPIDTINSIKSLYDAAGSDLDLAAFEAILAGAGLDIGQFMEILNHVDGEIDVRTVITELEIWKVQTLFLAAIAQNTARTALALSGGAVTAGNVLFAMYAEDWGAPAVMITELGELIQEMNLYGEGNKIQNFQSSTAPPATWEGWSDLPVNIVSPGGFVGVNATGFTFVDNIYLLVKDKNAEALVGIGKMTDALKVYVTGGVVTTSGGGSSTVALSMRDYAALQNITVATAALTNITAGEWTNAQWQSYWQEYGSVKYFVPAANMAEGAVVAGPTYAHIGEAGYPEAVIPMKDGVNIPVKWVNGGSTRFGATGQDRDEEIALLREQVDLQRELIDTLRAKDTSPRVRVSVDADSLAHYTGRYVSERTRRRTLDVRGS